MSDLRWIAEALGASEVRRRERLQSVWSGYGEIFRIDIVGGASPTAIVKWVEPPANRGTRDPRDARSHARKCRSYGVEMAWYRGLAKECDHTCRVPELLASRTGKDEWVFVLEDLDAAGFSERRRDPSDAETEACLKWLAAFHARFLGRSSDLTQQLWRAGTYWHLATRPDELADLDDAALQSAAPTLDRMLAECTYRTLVHGDAKPANFCFTSGGTKHAVAAVDFQYVGGGCGMKDVAYFLAGDDLTHANEARQLDCYFAHLHEALAARGEPSIDSAALEREWRTLYPIARVDFYRFLAGWSKAHWRSDARARRFVRTMLVNLQLPTK